MARVRTRANGGRKDITLMTLLANESTSDSRKLLKKYNKPDAVNTADLEVKLAELYYSVPDKIVFEKELAEIHPHKKWIMKYITPTPIASSVVEQANKDIENIEKGKDVVLSNASGCQYCNADGGFVKSQDTPKLSAVDYMGIIGLVAVIGLSFYALKR